jgi:cell pole-organizing protein PopZ
VIADPPATEPDEASIEALVGPEAAAAASASVSSLLHTLSAERHAQVYRGGPTLEDMVRELVRPMLKEWLDSNLPPMVERIVRAEIERVAGRAAL